MEKQYWRNRLNPYDAELALMVESLTGKPCELYYGGDCYFFEADYENHPEPEYILAIWDAIEGRAGKRLLQIKDNAERHALMVRVAFSDEPYPKIVRADRNAAPNPKAGSLYCGKLQEIRAVQVTKENVARLLAFVGNGQMEIPKEGPLSFRFLNAEMSVYCTAYEFSYIINDKPGHFVVKMREDFESRYERKE